MAGVTAAASGRSGIVRDATWYTAATYLSQFAAFAVGIASKRFLGPASLGVWAVLLSLLSFLGLIECGVLQATNKEMAYALSKGDLPRAGRYRDVNFSFVSLTGLLGTAGVLLYVFLKRGTLGDEFLYGLLGVALILPFSQFHMGQVTVFWANREFRATSLLAVLETVLTGTLGLLLIWRYGLYGQVAAFCLIVLAKILYLWRRARRAPLLAPGFAWDAPSLKRLLTVGVPLQIINLVNILKISAASLLVAYYLDTTAAGYYALALSIQNYIYWTPNAFSIVMFPRFQERFAENADDPKALLSYLVKPTVGLSFFVLPLLLSGSYFLVPTLIRHALPDYVPSIAVLKIVLAGTFFLSLEHMPGQLITTANRLWQRVALSLSSALVLALCVAVALLQETVTLAGLTAAFACGNALAFFVSFCYAYAISDGSRSDRWLWGKLVAAFLYLMLVLVTVDRLLPSRDDALLFDAGCALLKWGVGLLALSPLFLVAERQLLLVGTLRGFVRSRLGGALGDA